MTKIRLPLLILVMSVSVVFTTYAEATTSVEQHQNDDQIQSRAIFSPRVDYNEWMPVGRGDPLKNDPTYDYSPPVLDRVRYWETQSGRGTIVPVKEKQKGDILLLGVSSTKKSTPNKTKNLKNEPKYYPVRRNYFNSMLPTRLMPPPMYSGLSTSHSSHYPLYSEKYYYSNGMIQHSTGWPPRKGGEPKPESTNGYANIVRPNSNMVSQAQYMENNRSPSPPPTQSSSQNYESEIKSQNVKLVSSKYQYGGHLNEIISTRPHIESLLQKEFEHPSMTTPSVTPSPAMNNYFSTNSYVIMPSIEITTTSPIYQPPQNPTTTLPPPTFFLPTVRSEIITPTVAPSMTTDSLFSHYKQPEQPISGPMYLIIEGHSKVKTYGPNDMNEPVRHPPKIVPITTTDDPVIRHVVSKDESGDEMQVKHLHFKQENRNENKKKLAAEKEPSSMQSLITLLDSSFGNFLESDNKKQDNTLKAKLSKRRSDTRKERVRRASIEVDNIKEVSVGSTFQAKNIKKKFFYKKGTVLEERTT